MGIKRWVAIDESSDSKIGPNWQTSPPVSWIEDSSIKNIRATADLDEGDGKWQQILEKIENNFEWSESKKNNFFSNYPLFELRVRQEKYNDAEIHINDAEDNSDITTSEADDFRKILDLN